MTEPARRGSARSRRGQHGRYRLVERIASGSSSVVWRASRIGDAGAVAVKVPRATNARARSAIEHEVSVLRTLHDDRDLIVPLLDVVDDDDGPAIVLALAPAGSLADALRSGSLSAPRSLGIARRLAAAIALAHARGVVHGDLKPGNVLLPDHDRTWLADFDNAIRVPSGPSGPSGPSVPSDGRASRDRPLRVVGTMGFAPPEVLAGAAPTPAADVYSWGVVVGCSATGVAPGELPAQRHDGWGAVPAELRPLVAAALDPDPAARPRSGAELVRALSAGVAPEEHGRPAEDDEWDTPTVDIGPPRIEPPAARPRASRAERLALGAGVAALLVGVGLAVRSTELAGQQGNDPSACTASPAAGHP